MLHQPAGVIGIDKAISRYNAEMFDALRGVWGLAPTDWECYGRARIGTQGNGNIPQVPILSTQGNDYRDALPDDTQAVTSFWLTESASKSTIEGPNLTRGASLLFFVHLARLYPTVPVYADEALRRDLMLFFNAGSAGYGFRPTGVAEGVREALAEVSGTYRDLLAERIDAYPWHTIRLDFSGSVNYQNHHF